MKQQKIIKALVKFFLNSSKCPIYWDHNEMRDAVAAVRAKHGLDCFRGHCPQDLAYLARVAVIPHLWRLHGGMIGDVPSLPFTSEELEKGRYFDAA